MNEIEKLTELEKRISDLEREEYKNWKRISELESDAGKSAGRLTKEERGFTENYEAFSNLKTGTWIRLDTWQGENHDYMIDRNYINFAGETGTIVKNEVQPILGAYPIGETRQHIELKMDKHFPALDEFNNCLSWGIEERLRFDNNLCDYNNALFVECDELFPSFDILLDSGKTINGTGYGIKPKVLGQNIYNLLNMPVRLVHVLENNNINTIGDLVKQSRQDLLKLKSFGRKYRRYVEEGLERKGLSLRFYLIPKQSNDQENIRRIKEDE
jgi:hypothetical protein